TIRLGHGPDWTSDTVRSAGTALVRQNGILLNNAAITNGPAAKRGTYVGTTRSDASSLLNWIFGQVGSGGVAANLALWNMYNRVQVVTNVTDSGAAYTYSGATMRQARASPGNQINFINGLQEEGAHFTYSAGFQAALALGGSFIVGIGQDVTNGYTGSRLL